MSSPVFESLWREGLSMDSSIFSDDDDCVDWRWPAASSRRRCDRELETESHTARQNINTGWTSSSCGCSRSSSNSSSSHGSLEENFLYCTEELGSESVCGSADPCAGPPDKGASSSGSIPSMSAGHGYLQALDDSSFAPHHHHHQQYCSAAFRRGRVCSFPPPISSLLTDRPLLRSFKSNGRFILKKVANVSRSLFRTTRSNGSLRLDLALSSIDCVESQQAAFFPGAEDELLDAERASTSDVSVHTFFSNLKSGSIPDHLLRSPSPYSIFLQPKFLLNYAALRQPSKLQAIAMLVNPKGACCPVVEKSDAPLKAGCQQQETKDEPGGMTSAAMVHQAMVHQSWPRVFALLKVLPTGLGLIIFEIGGKSAGGGGHIRVHGMCILENAGGGGLQQCGRAAMVTTPPTSHGHLVPGELSVGGSMEVTKGQLFPLSNEGCRRERYMVKGVFA